MGAYQLLVDCVVTKGKSTQEGKILMRFTIQQVPRLECLCQQCFIEYFGFLPIDINQGNFPTHGVKVGSQCFGLRCDVTGSPYKMIWTHVALHRVAGIELSLFLLCQYAFTCTIFQF